jgi:hypothetical protein
VRVQLRALTLPGPLLSFGWFPEVGKSLPLEIPKLPLSNQRLPQVRAAFPQFPEKGC